jgi:alpha-glucosidase (family GH31 glycosyl hydrolase)
MDKLLDLGIDGWKCDGTDPYLELVVGPRGFSGPMSLLEYQDFYYGDFYNYTLSKNPDGLIMSRPVDSFQVSKGQVSAFLPFSPKYVMFSGWVGDQDPTFDGLKAALTNMMWSSWYNYTNFGSDIGGYRGGQRTAELMVRWT